MLLADRHPDPKVHEMILPLAIHMGRQTTIQYGDWYAYLRSAYDLGLGFYALAKRTGQAPNLIRRLTHALIEEARTQL